MSGRCELPANLRKVRSDGVRRDQDLRRKAESPRTAMRALSNPLVLIGPAILLVFAASFASVWIWNRRHRHLLFFCAACLLFCLGTLSQILGIPDG